VISSWAKPNSGTSTSPSALHAFQSFTPHIDLFRYQIAELTRMRDHAIDQARADFNVGPCFSDVLELDGSSIDTCIRSKTDKSSKTCEPISGVLNTRSFLIKRLWTDRPVWKDHSAPSLILLVSIEDGVEFGVMTSKLCCLTVPIIPSLLNTRVRLGCYDITREWDRR
jgi:hypothetical protein